MNKICIYLRKSRADEEMERELGVGETLAKHRKALLKFAKEKNLNIVEIKEEIVSGESLFFRPKMLELLKEVEAKTYAGVLVMDMQRLGRGDMKEQGIILETFKVSNTKIITPQKTYDLNNDFDEEYTEFEAFMSRKELKMINRRMQGGRLRSVEDGNYLGTSAPLGYEIAYVKKSRTLKINENEAEIIKVIFNMYTEGDGATKIATFLNSCGYKTKMGKDFTNSSILAIIKNPVYIGQITWKKREYKKSKEVGKLNDCRTRDKDDWIVSKGKHNAIIEEGIFLKAKEILNNRYHIPYKLKNPPVNPVAGIAVCSVCGKKLVVRPLRGVLRIMCINKCNNKSVKFELFERELISSLEEYLASKEIRIKNDTSNKNEINIYKKQIDLLSKELKTLEEQRLKLFDFLERGIYNEDVFLERSKNIDSRIEGIKSNIASMDEMILAKSNETNKKDILLFKSAIEVYKKSKTAKEKNDILKNILYRVEYLKDSKGSELQLKIFPRL